MTLESRRILSLFYAERDSWVVDLENRTHFNILNIYLSGHCFNFLLLALVYWTSVPGWLVAVWLMSGLIVCAHRSLLRHEYKSKIHQTDPNKLQRKLTWNTFAFSLVSGAAYAYLSTHSTTTQSLVLLVGLSISVCSIVLNFNTLPSSALIYSIVVSCSAIVPMFFASDINVIVTGFLLTAAVIVTTAACLSSHKRFVTRIIRKRELEETTETIRLLLNDYEDQGSDWLFELEFGGKLSSVNERFAAAFGQSPEELAGRDFISLFKASPERDQLADHLKNNRVFRSLDLAVDSGENELWWSVSARPSSDTTHPLGHFRGVIRDISSEKRAQERARHMAHYDVLTELPNRFHFNSELEQLATHLQTGQHFCLLLIDVDKFKAVNDTLGHPIGDLFLRAMSQRISDCVRISGLGSESYIIARLGGDEFGILMSGENVIDHAIRLADHLVTQAGEPFLIAGHQITSGLSIGLVIAPNDGDRAEQIMHNADLALYYAKDQGRGRWERFEPIMDIAIQERHAMERDLRKALAKNELKLYFQPLVSAESGEHVGFEALLRWHQSERGIVMPDDFIPLAEETGLIVPIGEWIIREAMTQAAMWDLPLGVAVNISPVQMRSPNLLPTIISALANSGLDPARFEVEITEGVLLHDTDENMAMLHKFHDIGIKIALDDFGTGYSSLNYLRTFPFDKIKIDRSFINGLENHRDCREIVSAVIGLANNLGMVTLAEGVEEQGQLDELRRGGCTMVQGWLFGKAMPAEHYAALRRNKRPDSIPLLSETKAAA